jgi:hypothetical protein
MAYAPVYVEAPAIVRPSYGLLDSVPVLDGGGHAALGIEFESAYCGPAYDTVAACVAQGVGTISVSVDNNELATLTSVGAPDGLYTINWGDGTVVTGQTEQLNDTNTYAAAGTYTVQVFGENVEYYATVQVTVVENTVSGPFAADARVSKLAVDGITLVTGEPIPVYHMFQCRAVGSWDRGVQRAQESLDLGASRVVEGRLAALLASGATDVTPGGIAVNLVDGLALLEDYAGLNYGGRPVIHVSRGIALKLIAAQAVFRVGDHLETGLGSLVVAGAGYLSSVGPSAAAAGAGWMLASGAVTVWKAGADVTEQALDNPYTNQFKALAEGVYVPTYECFHAAVEVDVTATP